MQGSGNGKGAGNRRNVIDQGTTFKGVLTATSTVVVLGVIEGEVSGPAVEVEESGVLRGKAKLAELRSRGELAGEFEADEVELSGRVRDETVIRAKSLLVSAPGRAGGSEATFGECQIDVGEVPSKEQAIAAALAANRAAPAAPVLTMGAPSADGHLGAGGAATPVDPFAAVVAAADAAGEAEEDPTVIISRERANAVLEPASDMLTAPAAAPAPVEAAEAPPSPEGEAAPSTSGGRRGKRSHAERPADGN
jgi:cytoskeletal protein CcmA (bactofilin family)